MKQKISNIILSGFVKSPVYFFLFLITGFVLFEITDSLYSFIIAIPLVVIIHIYRANKEINNYEKLLMSISKPHLTLKINLIIMMQVFMTQYH